MNEAIDVFNAAAPAPVEANTVLGVPEKQFRTMWISMLSGAMLKTGKGFRADPSTRRQPRGAAEWRGERRSDKAGTSKLTRGLLAAAR